MKLTIDSVDYWVSWKHTIPVCTQCIISTTGFKIESTGVSLCSPKDKFEKEIGRKISLETALEIYPKSKRTLFWNAYFNRK